MTALACGACGRRFSETDHLALHEGRAHPDRLDADGRARFAEAEAREEAWLATFRRHVRGGLATLPVVATLLVVLLLVHLSGIPIFLGFLLIPGSLAFAAVLYYLSWSRSAPPS